MGNWIRALRRVLDYVKDPDPNHWRTINGAKVHLDASGKYDGGAQGKFNGRYHYGPDWKTKSALMNRLAGALHAGVNKGNQNNSGQQAGNSGTVKTEIKETNFPPEYNQPKEKKNIKVAASFLNKLKDQADPEVYNLYSLFGEIAKKTGAVISINHRGEDGYVKGNLGFKPKFEIRVPILGDKKLAPNAVRGRFATWAHENMHAIDLMLGKTEICGRLPFRSFVSESDSALTTAINAAHANGCARGGKLFSEEALQFIKDYRERKQKSCDIWAKKKEAFRKFNEKAWAQMEKHPERFKTIADVSNKIKAEMQSWYDREVDNWDAGDFACLGNFTDMYDAISGGYVYDRLRLSGHGSRYYKKGGGKNRNSELLAQWATLKIMAPNLAGIFKKDYPDVAEALDGVVNNLTRNLKEGNYG